MTKIIPAMRLSMIVMLLLVTASVQAHELHYSTTQGRAILIDITYPDHGGLAGAPYEIRAKGDSTPIQMGWTDGSGRIAFAPSSSGAYQVSVFSEGGHGVNFAFDVGEDFLLEDAEQPLIERHLKLLVGVGVILGLFGLLMLFYRRRPA